jgi:hypothetical protein
MKNKDENSESSNENFFTEDEIIDIYSSRQAEEDGIIVNIKDINTKFDKSMFNYVTTNLLIKCGYIKYEEYKIYNIIDLFNQATHIMRLEYDKSKVLDDFYCGKIELPNGTKQEIFIQRNETGKYTIMLPEDY